jgi:hypothetical protein
MKIIKGQAVLDRDEALKGLWASIEAMLKAVKSLMGTQGTGYSRTSQTGQVEVCLQACKFLEGFKLEPGTLVKMIHGSDSGEFLVGRFEGFIDQDPLRALLTVAAATEKYRWDTITERMEMNLNRLEEMEGIDQDDLPTYAGSTFMGRLFDELLKKGTHDGAQ